MAASPAMGGRRCSSTLPGPVRRCRWQQASPPARAPAAGRLPGTGGRPGQAEHAAGGGLGLEGVLWRGRQGPGRGHHRRRARLHQRPAQAAAGSGVVRLEDGERGGCSPTWWCVGTWRPTRCRVGWRHAGRATLRRPIWSSTSDTRSGAGRPQGAWGGGFRPKRAMTSGSHSGSPYDMPYLAATGSTLPADRGPVAKSSARSRK
jgi:hypothetical protein